MSAINPNPNIHLSLDEFHAFSNGTHNVGELKLTDHGLKIVNNHVWKTGQNNTILSADENRLVRRALLNALESDIGSNDVARKFIEEARAVLLDGGNENKSLTREVVRLLYDAEQKVKGEGDAEVQDILMAQIHRDLGENVKSLAQRNVAPGNARDLMRSSREAAFRLTVNERRDRLRDILAQHFPDDCNSVRKDRFAELKTLFFGKDDEPAVADLAKDNPKLARFRTWLMNFDAKAQDADGGHVSDDQALKNLKNLLDLDCLTHFVLNQERREQTVEGMLTDLFRGKGGEGLATKDRLHALLFADENPADDAEGKVAEFRSWLRSTNPCRLEGRAVPDDEAASKLKAQLQTFAEGITAMPLKDRTDAVNKELDALFDGKGGVGREAKARLAALLFEPESAAPSDLTDNEKKIAAFRGWATSFDTPARDGENKIISDAKGLERLVGLLRDAGAGVNPMHGMIRGRVVDLALEQCAAKGGYGQAMKERLTALLFGSDKLDDLTDTEQKIAAFKGWVTDFNMSKRDENDRVMSDRKASEQLQALLQKVNDEIEPMRQEDRAAAVKELLQRHFFSQGGMGRVVGARLEQIFDTSVDQKELSADEQKLLAFREWQDDFTVAAKGEDGRALSDKAALERLTALLEKMGKAIKPMSVEDRQKAAMRDLDGLFAPKGGYGLAMKERLRTILLGTDNPNPADFRDDTERSLGIIFRKWLHDFNAVAEDTEARGRQSLLFDEEGGRHLRELLQKVADGIEPMLVADRRAAVQRMLQEKFFGRNDNGADLGNHLNGIFEGTQRPDDDTERGIARFGKWLIDFDTVALDEDGHALSDASALERLDALLQTESQKLLSPGEKRKREAADAIGRLLQDKQKTLDAVKEQYETAADELSLEFQKLNDSKFRTMAWWQLKHRPDFEKVWSLAVEAGNKAFFGVLTAEADLMGELDFDSKFITDDDWKNLDLDEAVKAFQTALASVLGTPIEELKDMAETIRGYSTSADMKDMAAQLQEDVGSLLGDMGATDAQKQHVLAALPAELERRVYHSEEHRGDGLDEHADPKVTLYNLIEGGEKKQKVVDQILGETKFWAQRQLMELREADVQKRIQDLQQTCLQKGREQALRQIVAKLESFNKMSLTDGELEGSVGSHPGLRLDEVRRDADIQRLLAEQSRRLVENFEAKVRSYVEKGAALPPELTGPITKGDAFSRLTEDVAKVLTEKFTASAAVSGQIGAYAGKIREARYAEFAKLPEIDNLANTLAQGVANRIVGHFEGLFKGKAADKSLFWMSSAGKSTEFDGDFSQKLFADVKKPIMMHMSRVYCNRHAVTARDVEQDCEYTFAAVRNLLKGFSALYRNLVVDKKNFVSHAKIINRSVAVAETDEAVETVCTVMRDEALTSVRTVLENLKDYLNDVEDAKMKEEISRAAERVVDNEAVRALWHTHKDESRNRTVREGLLRLTQNPA